MIDWPKIPEKELIAETVLAEIAKNLPSYALDVVKATSRGANQVRRAYGNFQGYCIVVKKDYFEAVVRNIKGPLRSEARKLAAEAFGLIDLLLEYVGTQFVRTTFDRPLRFGNISPQWDTVVGKWNMLLVENQEGQDIVKMPSHYIPCADIGPIIHKRSDSVARTLKAHQYPVVKLANKYYCDPEHAAVLWPKWKKHWEKIQINE